MPTLARVRATLILCQSPSSEEVQFLGFSLDLTKDTSMQSLSLPCLQREYHIKRKECYLYLTLKILLKRKDLNTMDLCFVVCAKK